MEGIFDKIRNGSYKEDSTLETKKTYLEGGGFKKVDWDYETVQQKPFCHVIPKHTAAILNINLKQTPHINDNLKYPHYYYLSNVEFLKLIDKSGEEIFDNSDNSILQFSAGTKKALTPFFKNPKSEIITLVIYRITERTTYALELDNTKKDESLNLKNKELINKYFTKYGIKSEYLMNLA